RLSGTQLCSLCRRSCGSCRHLLTGDRGSVPASRKQAFTMNKNGRAHFITLEGGEGAGKSTQAKKLSAELQKLGITSVLTREPGGSPGAEEIRKLLVEGEPGRWDALTEALLMFAARADHLARTIKPALAAHKWVIADRFTDSTYV